MEQFQTFILYRWIFISPYHFGVLLWEGKTQRNTPQQSVFIRLTDAQMKMNAEAFLCHCALVLSLSIHTYFRRPQSCCPKLPAPSTPCLRPCDPLRIPTFRIPPLPPTAQPPSNRPHANRPQGTDPSGQLQAPTPELQFLKPNTQNLATSPVASGQTLAPRPPPSHKFLDPILAASPQLPVSGPYSQLPQPSAQIL